MAIKVLVVDDSILFRTTLQLKLSADPNIKVVGCASNGKEALDLINKLNLDVITLDVEMPDISGLELLKKYLPTKPIPTIVVTSSPMNAFEAIEIGAVEFIRKPTSDNGSVLQFIESLKQTIKVASEAKIRTYRKQALSPTLNIGTISPKKDTIVAIGASTGGTEAILEVVKNMPANSPPIIVVQHMPEKFTKMYAERLDRICKMKVVEATDNERVEQGKIIIGAGGYHLTLKKDVRGYYVRSQQGEKVSGHCPSVDVMFDSVADVAGKNSIGVILTGMGADGAKGITKLHGKGAYTIGQDKASCVVYGMPMEAFKLGGISKEYPLDFICSEVLHQVKILSK